MTAVSLLRKNNGACLFMLFLFFGHPALAQDVGDPEIQKVTAKEWNLEFFINTSGGGLGFQQGRTPDYYNKAFWEINFLYNKHPKAVRAIAYANDATAYSYGKMCDLFFLRGGYGYQRVLNHKPYYGGVQIRYTISGGFSLGMGVPVYVKIRLPGQINTLIERYDPENPDHSINNIIGRAGFFHGVGKTMLRPGFYAKTGFNFDFSQNYLVIHAVEIGMAIDMVFPAIQQMAKNKAKPFYLCAYIAYHFGKKKGPGD